MTPNTASLRLLELFHTCKVYPGRHYLRCQPRPHAVVNHTPRPMPFPLHCYVRQRLCPKLNAIPTAFYICYPW